MVHSNKNNPLKTDLAILERFSSDELWLLFVEKKCQECNIPEEECDSLKAQNCRNEWIRGCD